MGKSFNLYLFDEWVDVKKQNELTFDCYNFTKTRKHLTKGKSLSAE